MSLSFPLQPTGVSFHESQESDYSGAKFWCIHYLYNNNSNDNNNNNDDDDDDDIYFWPLFIVHYIPSRPS